MTPYDSTNITLPRPTDAQSIPKEGVSEPSDGVPTYMHDVYDWAYLNPRNVALLDRNFIVDLILWGNSERLKQALLTEIEPEHTVLQAAHVYGSLVSEIAARLANPNQLEVVEVAPVQAERCRHKLRDFPGAVIRVEDAATVRTTPKDVVSSFFLLHEVPTDYKRAVVNTLLSHVNAGGKAVFVDYHKSHKLHPLRPLMRVVFDLFEPFARELCAHNISDYADEPDAFSWHTETMFGGLYQKTVARRRPASD